MIKRHTRWNWIILGDFRMHGGQQHAYVMDDFGNAVEITYSVTRISLREGDA